MTKIKKIDLSVALRKYSNKWLALKPNSNSVVASGKELKKVIQAAKEKGVVHPVVTRAPKNYGAYILSQNEFQI